MPSGPAQEGMFLTPSWIYPNQPDAVPAAIQQRESLTANLLNIREIGAYQLFPTVTGQTWPTENQAQTRTALRRVIEFTLPNATTLNIPHGIPFTETLRLTRLSGGATKSTTPREAIPLPYVSTISLASQVSLGLTETNLVVTTGADYSAYTAFVVIEWLPS